MKVCIAVMRAPMGLLGGPSESIDALASGLVKKEADVTVIAPPRPRDANHRMPGWSDSDQSYKIRNYSDIPWKDKNLRSCAIRFIKYIRSVSGDYDIMQCHLTNPALSPIADMISTDKTRIVANFGVPLIEHMTPLFSGLKKSPLRYMMRMGMNNRFFTKILPRILPFPHKKFSCEKYVVSSEYQRKQLISKGFPSEKTAVIPNSLDLRKNRHQDRAKSRKHIGFGRENIIGYLGHFTHNKGADVLIDAFPEILREFPESRLVLAWSGFGSKEKMVMSRIRSLGIQDDVTILKKVDVPMFMSSLDVLAVPLLFAFGTHWFPNTILEAMSVGTPLVSSRVGGMEEIVNGKTGLLVEPGDSKSLAEAIKTLLSDKKLCSRMREEQRRLIAERFDAEKVAEQYMKMYEEIRNEGKG